jgi:hypothetical protein
VEYELVPTTEVEHIAAFTGPQLSFEFSVPQFAEDAIATHITSTSTPWSQERYDNPAADVTDPIHRTRLADRYDAIGSAASLGTLVATIREAVSDPDAPTDEGLTTRALSVETVALLESEPTAIPTFGGLAVARNVPEGDHRFTVNGAGLAPHSETVTASAGEATAAGVGGRVALVAREDALKLSVDADGTDRDLTGLAVEDDFAGRLYDAPLSGPDGVYVHRGGAYTTEVRDDAGDLGAFRVNPSGTDRVTIDRPETGVASLASFLADIAEETREDVEEIAEDDEGGAGRDGNGGGRGAAVRGLAQALAAVGEAAARAAEEAEAEDRERAEAALDTVASRLETVAERLAAARDGLPPGLGRAVENRLGQARRRTDRPGARSASTLSLRRRRPGTRRGSPAGRRRPVRRPRSRGRDGRRPPRGPSGSVPLPRVSGGGCGTGRPRGRWSRRLTGRRPRRRSVQRPRPNSPASRDPRVSGRTPSRTAERAAFAGGGRRGDRTVSTRHACPERCAPP